MNGTPCDESVYTDAGEMEMLLVRCGIGNYQLTRPPRLDRFHRSNPHNLTRAGVCESYAEIHRTVC